MAVVLEVPQVPRAAGVEGPDARAAEGPGAPAPNHEKAHPQPVIRKLDGTPIGPDYRPDAPVAVAAGVNGNGNGDAADQDVPAGGE